MCGCAARRPCRANCECSCHENEWLYEVFARAVSCWQKKQSDQRGAE